jgi:CzcA family heavy metal efflux pump
MFNAIIRFSLQHRLLVFVGALLLLGVGGYQAAHLPIDVLPDLNRPRVTIMTEALGMAAEEVEMRVTTPLETVLNGATGVLAVRGNSTVGLSIITVEFDWGTNVYAARQIVGEKLTLAAHRLPEDVKPQMAPISSVMGQIMILGLWSEKEEPSPRELRTIADWEIRKQLLSVSGVAEVFVMGGERAQYNALVRPDDLLKYGVTLGEVEKALRESSENVTGGYLTNQGAEEFLVRSMGQVTDVRDLQNLVVKPRSPNSVLLKHVADVREGFQVKRGDSAAYIRGDDGKFSGGPAVILTVEKQPEKDSRKLTEDIHKGLHELEASLKTRYPGLRIESLYEQRNYINLAIDNVVEALWVGGLLVVLVLVVFLMNFRTTCITLLAIPLSLVMTALVFAWFGLSINTMTLGGLAVAIGELVDDAIVDVENIFRRLRENRRQGSPRSAIRVVYDASREIRNSVVFSTFIVVLVFFPLFWLSGMEGRLFTPLGIAYIVSILCSLLVSLTVTPVLAYWLLPRISAIAAGRDGLVLRVLKWAAGLAIRFSLAFPRFVLVAAALAALVAAGTFFSLKRDFTPPFNEGALQLNINLLPGKSLESSVAVARALEQRLQQIEGVQTIIRKTGRAELDEHAVPVNTTEFILTLSRNRWREQARIVDEVKTLIDKKNLPGTAAFCDQPLQHLLAHLRTGSNAQIAVKLKGDDLIDLRRRAKQIETAIQDIPSVGTLRTEPIQADVPQLRIELDRERLKTFGLTPRAVNELIETAMRGRVVAEMMRTTTEGAVRQRFYEIVLQLTPSQREDLEALRRLTIPLPSGGAVPLRDIADINAKARGPNQIDHEAGRRQVIVQSNPQKRGVVEVKQQIERALKPIWPQLEAGGYELSLEGLFKSEEEASRKIAILSGVSLLGIFLVLYTMFGSANLSLQVMSALPMALIGAVVAMVVTGQDRTIPTLVGLISLCGIASRNGILLLDHYLHLVKYEGETWSHKMLIRAGQERLAPVMMTALTAALGLVPLALAAGQPGKELLYPIATVVIGGLCTSTLLEFFVRPALFWTFGREAAEKVVAQGRSEAAALSAADEANNCDSTVTHFQEKEIQDAL